MAQETIHAFWSTGNKYQPLWLTAATADHRASNWDQIRMWTFYWGIYLEFSVFLIYEFSISILFRALGTGCLLKFRPRPANLASAFNLPSKMVIRLCFERNRLRQNCRLHLRRFHRRTSHLRSKRDIQHHSQANYWNNHNRHHPNCCIDDISSGRKEMWFIDVEISRMI